MLTKLIERVAGNIVWITCRAYDPFEENCQKLLPKPGTKPHSKYRIVQQTDLRLSSSGTNLL